MSDPTFKLLEDYLADSCYRIQQPVSRKNGRMTLLAYDQQTQMDVIIKLLIFRERLQRDDLRLFQQEVVVLQSLSHPSLPKYIDSFEIDNPSIKALALVQNHIDGKSLAHYLQKGKRFSEGEIKQLTFGVLDILSYLHNFNPQIVHGDIKPSNILLKNHSAHHVGEIYLVGLDSIRSHELFQHNTTAVVRADSYMPPEQLRRRLVPGSDLYSLGATIIYLITGCHLAGLPQQELKRRFQFLASRLSPEMQTWLTWLTQPSIENRPTSALEAWDALIDGWAPNPNLDIAYQRDDTRKVKSKESVDVGYALIPGSRIIITKAKGQLKISIPVDGQYLCQKKNYSSIKLFFSKLRMVYYHTSIVQKIGKTFIFLLILLNLGVVLAHYMLLIAMPIHLIIVESYLLSRFISSIAVLFLAGMPLWSYFSALESQKKTNAIWHYCFQKNRNGALIIEDLSRFSTDISQLEFSEPNMLAWMNEGIAFYPGFNSLLGLCANFPCLGYIAIDRNLFPLNDEEINAIGYELSSWLNLKLLPKDFPKVSSLERRNNTERAHDSYY